MPTFDNVKVKEKVEFDFAKNHFLESLEEFKLISDQGKLPKNHALFGEMSYEDWGFLEYKHIHHHLKQFGI